MKKRSYKSPDILFVNLKIQYVIATSGGGGDTPGPGGGGTSPSIPGGANQRGTSIWDD